MIGVIEFQTVLDVVATGSSPQGPLITTNGSGFHSITLGLHLLPMLGLGLTKIGDKNVFTVFGVWNNMSKLGHRFSFAASKIKVMLYCKQANKKEILDSK